ncbi:MAG: DUF4380 domain-containing protein [Bacteroidales bacterium]
MRYLLLILASCLVFSFGCKSVTDKQNIFSGENDSLVFIKSGSSTLAVDPTTGARFVSLEHKGTELLTGPEVNKQFYGSSLWLSPQKKYWPPSPVLDVEPYSHEIDGEQVTFLSKTDSLSGFQYTKKIVPLPEKNGFEIIYTIENITDSVKGVAAWEVTRLPKDGLSFFPLGEIPLDSCLLLDSVVDMTVEDNIMWHKYQSDDINFSPKKSKLFCDGAEGWIAYVHERVLFVKRFEDLSPTETAPGETDIEIYVNVNQPYIEIEVQSAYKLLQPAEKIEWSVTWNLAGVPGNTDIETGNRKLLDLVNHQQ